MLDIVVNPLRIGELLLRCAHFARAPAAQTAGKSPSSRGQIFSVECPTLP
ncbi:hypothetical protein [Paraburkholderia tagetis]|uniref:Uncharacterized protein n=1 Tax=Paraburkholderia tagetis TaxID=2913261 RepID=A0A9X1UKW4_9BURK|nr:hypothetical protein [Paraburkholderia tagetis]MCG5076241.1 hypothetical protein [Paraburkholderia tagetis]